MKAILALLMLCGLVASGAHALGRGSGGASSLQRVPWEGGPAYWAQFSTTNAAGWTNPTFFPIGVWEHFDLRPITTQSQIDGYKNAWVNGFVPVNGGHTPNPDMTLIRTNGMWALASLINTGALPPGIGTETVGYFIDDEDDWIYGPGSNPWSGVYAPRDKTTCSPPNPPNLSSFCGLTAMTTMKSRLPVDGRPYAANWSPYMTGPSVISMTPTQQRQFVNGYSNMFTALDSYWYANSFTCGASQGGAQALGLPFTTALTSTQCHRAANYGANMRTLRGINAAGGSLLPAWGFVETGCVTCAGGDTNITGPQLQGAVWSMIINEARGILYFDVNLAGACIGEAILLNCNGIAPFVTAVNLQVKNLATVINTQSYGWSFNANVNTMLKRGPDNKWYIFAMQTGFNDSNTYTFTLPPNFTTASTATVLNESRTVAISGGAFSDAFANEYDHHIYQVTP